MRVTRTELGERGAVLPIVAVFAVVAMIFLAFVIDIGNERQNRRQLTTATDSPSLAVAGEWAEAGGNPAGFTGAGDGCAWTSVDETLVAENNPVGNASPVYSCVFSDVVPLRSATVTVDSAEVVDYALDGFTGVGEGDTASLTSVRVQPIAGGGLRPVAICTGDFSTAGWSSPAPGILVAPPSSSTTLTLQNTQGNSDDACDVNGNWNQVIFRASNTCPGQGNASGGSQVFRDQYANGSPYDVSVNDCVSRAPGSGGLSSGDLSVIEDMIVTLPVFESAAGGGAGIYRVVGFLEVFVVSAQQVNPGNRTVFEFEPLRYVTSGKCCLINEFNLDLQVCDTGTLRGAASPNAATRCQARDLTSNPPPPPIPVECEVQSIAPNRTSAGRQGAQLRQIADEVVFTITVDSVADCTGFQVSLVNDGQSNRENELDVVAVDATTFTATEQVGQENYRTNGQATTLWNLRMVDDDGAVSFTPTVSVVVS